MIVEAARFEAVHYTIQYEILRSQVIGIAGNVARENTAGQPRGIGLALFLNEGMPGWLRTVEQVLRDSPEPRAGGLPDSCPQEGLRRYRAPVCLPNVHRHQITTLLASLVLSTRFLGR
jgi:hypothetical protein